MTERIDINLVSLSSQQVIQGKHCFLEIHEKYVRYAVAFLANEPDEDLGMTEETVTDYEIIAAKDAISGIQKYYNQVEKVWMVNIFYDEDIKTFHKHRRDAEAIYTKLFDYLFGDNSDEGTVNQNS